VADKALSVSLSHSLVLVLLEKLSYIEDRAQTDRVIIVADPNHRTDDSDFESRASYGRDPYRRKINVKRSGGSKASVEITNGWTNAAELIIIIIIFICCVGDKSRR